MTLSNNRPHAVLVADEGPGIGLGHRRRCEFLAAALRDVGIAAEVVGTDADAVVDAPVLVVDSYLTRADDRLRYRSPLVIAFEDLGRDLDVDLLVVPAPGADTRRYVTARRVLAGAAYAQVDPSLPGRVTRSVEDLPARPSVLVTTGAADERGLGAAVAGEIARNVPHAIVRLVVGPWGASDVPDGVEPIVAPNGLADELVAADVVVTAGGITMLEALALGRPSVVIPTADNQRAQIAGVADAAAAWVTSPADAPARVRTLLADADARRNLQQRARALVDGRGASRVATVIGRLAKVAPLEVSARG